MTQYTKTTTTLDPTAGTSQFQHKYDVYPSFDEKTDLELRGTGSTNSFDISAGFDLILVES